MTSPFNVYKANQVNTTSKEKLILMLFDGAIKFLTKAVVAVEEKNHQDAHTNLLRSQDIIIALMSGLNMKAGEISSNLFVIYEYMYYKLVEANTKKDKRLVTEVLEMVKELRDTWGQILPKSLVQADSKKVVG